MSIEITKLTLEEELNCDQLLNVKPYELRCAHMNPNKMTCPKRVVYKRKVESVKGFHYDFLCEAHYQLLCSTVAGKKHKVQ